MNADAVELLGGALHPDPNGVLDVGQVEEPGERIPGEGLERPDLDDVQNAFALPADLSLDVLDVFGAPPLPPAEIVEPAQRSVDRLGLAQIAVETLVDEHL